MTTDRGTRPLVRVGRHAFVYAVGMLTSRAVAFVMLPIYTRYLTPADYGTIELILVTFEVVSLAAGSQLGAGIFHFFHKVTSETARRQLLATTFLLMALSHTVASGAAYVAAPALARLVFGAQNDPDLIRITAASLAFSSLLVVPLAYLQVRERSTLYVGINIARLVLQLALNVVFVVGLRLGVKGVLLSTLIVNVVAGLGLAAFLIRDVGLSWSRESARDVLRFGIPFVGTQVANLINIYGDRFFLQRVANVAEVGLYGLAYQFGFLLHYVGLEPFHNVWDPIRFEIAKRPDRDELYARAFVYFNIVYVTVAVGIALLVHDFLRVMSDPAFHRAANIVPVILLAYVLHGWTEHQNLGVLIRERTERITWANWVAAAVALVCYALLIPPLRGLGAALATVAAFGVRYWLVYRFAQRLWPVRYRWAPVARLLVLATAVVGISALLPPSGLVVSLVARAALLLLYAAGVWYAGILTGADRVFVRRLVCAPREAMASLRGAAEI